MKAIEIYCAIASKDTIVDFLLLQEQNDFYFFTCSRYGAGGFLVSAEEQVSARAKFGVFRLFMEQEMAEKLAVLLKGHLKDKTIKIVVYDCKEI